MIYFYKKLVVLLLVIINLCACATHPARQVPSEWNVLKSPLIQGEKIIQANSCSKLPAATFLSGGEAVFGSCYLTNLRFIYEESEWARNLTAISKMIPTSGDFGIKNIVKGAYEVFNANYIIDLGNNGKLHVVERKGRIIIPLSNITVVKVSGSRFSSQNAGSPDNSRWVTLKTKDHSEYVFEIYNLPPDKTKMMAAYASNNWRKMIEMTKNKSYK